MWSIMGMIWSTQLKNDPLCSVHIHTMNRVNKLYVLHACYAVCLCMHSRTGSYIYDNVVSTTQHISLKSMTKVQDIYFLPSYNCTTYDGKIIPLFTIQNIGNLNFVKIQQFNSLWLLLLVKQTQDYVNWVKFNIFKLEKVKKCEITTYH